MPFKDRKKKLLNHKRYFKENKNKIYAKSRESFLKKPIEEQNAILKRRREASTKWYIKNRDKILLKNKERGHFYSLKQLYNLTENDYNNILLKQNNVCDICKCKPFEKKWTSSKLPFSVDHSHDTKKVRGLLCDNCNVMIGHAHEDIEILKNAIIYLKKWKAKKQKKSLKMEVG